jgi:hypothetical protein
MYSTIDVMIRDNILGTLQSPPNEYILLDTFGVLIYLLE